MSPPSSFAFVLPSPTPVYGYNQNVVGARRAAYRILTSLADQEGAKEGHAVELDICNSYKDKIATELESVCNDVLGLLEEKLIPNAQEVRETETETETQRETGRQRHRERYSERDRRRARERKREMNRPACQV